MLSADPEQCVTKLEKETGIKNILSVIKSLLDKEAIFVKEELRRTYKPNDRNPCTPHRRRPQRTPPAHLLRRVAAPCPKQLDLLMKYLELSGYLSGRDIKESPKPNCCNAPPPPLPYSTVLWTVVYSKSTSRK